MDVDLLQTFLAIYRAGSLTAAARARHLSQPAVTQQLKTLERQAGKPLFVRLARGVAPTAAAHALARDVAGPLDALQAATQRLRPGGDDLAGTVFLGGPVDLLAAAALPALVPVVAQGVRLRVTTGLADDLLAALAEGALDVVIATQRTRRSGIDYEPLVDEDFVLVAAPSWARRIDPDALRVAGLAALADVPIVAYAEDLPIIRRWFRAVLDTRLTVAAAIVIDDLRGVMGPSPPVRASPSCRATSPPTSSPAATSSTCVPTPAHRPTPCTWPPAATNPAAPASLPSSSSCAAPSPPGPAPPEPQRSPASPSAAGACAAGVTSSRSTRC